MILFPILISLCLGYNKLRPIILDVQSDEYLYLSVKSNTKYTSKEEKYITIQKQTLWNVRFNKHISVVLNSSSINSDNK